jgi:CBS domain-containing protein
MKVDDVMQRDVHTVWPETSLKHVAAMLSEHGIGGMPVIDHHERPLGVVSTADIVIKEWAEIPGKGLRAVFRRRGSDPVAAKVNARTAGEAMSAPAVTIERGMPLSVAVERMLAGGVNRLPVVEQERLVGIVTSRDLVRAFARGDAELESEIRREALEGRSWTDEIDVEIRNGEVTLRGQVDSVFDARALPIQVRHILGVVSVDSELSGWDPERRRQVAVGARL